MSDSASCALCGSNDRKVVYNKAGLKRGETRDVTNVICRRCGLVYNNPMPTKDELRQFYTGKYLQESTGLMGDYENIIARIQARPNEEKIINIFKFIKPFLRPDTLILDVGCSTGMLLNRIANEIKCQATGIEPDPLMARVASEYFKIDDVENVFLEDFLNNNAKKFNFIILRHVLEHLEDPNMVLSSIVRILEKNGYLYIVVPNAFDFKPSKNLADSLEYGHLYSFTPYTVKKILSKHGLKVVKWSFDYTYSLQFIATLVDNPVIAVTDNELNSGRNVWETVFKLRIHNLRHLFFRFHRKLKRIFY